MTDLKSLAYELLSEAQETMQREGHLNPATVVITPAENLNFDLEFHNDEERADIYGEMMDVARKKNAQAILTVNDVFVSSSGIVPQLHGEGSGATTQTAQEAIVITVSGSGFATWSVICSYSRRDLQFIFQPAREMPNPGGEVDLLGDWTGNAGAA